ncbi:hypothetical protein TcasGA2_TC032055 [Tribolium castaneum]|uniref:DUF4485 domain-containing protein n=1 Tax=Tribolium castaneum TaxID=7070 RepID=A0A139WMK6_TRICA|nr:PREDICTED: uncharacterized protein LOC103315161 [Tribolium castaneum]KYB29081.1 hypothetical protein TcasGA2_TC032055 [Tribolium castaneum]|eukprot:XP_008201343.1 PREDICTED: uncharacterized protein LOC103315161 [Tribolium castaneum]
MTTEANEQFYYNLMLAKALVQLMPATDRQHIRIWFDVLADLDSSEQELAIRNEYIWFILLMLQNNKIEEYFKDLPPRKVLPLRKVLPQKVIDDVLITCDQNMSWLDTVTDDEKEKNLDKKKIPPEMFLNSQPLPKEGVISYFGAFSDHS